MKPLFDRAVRLVLKHEGGYVHDLRDAGGETKYGISQRSYPDLDIAALTEAGAIAIYRRDWWDKYGYDRLAEAGGERLAAKVFDLAVNMGAMRAHKLLQSALSERGLVLAVDGIIGPVTLAAVRACDRAELLRNFQYRAVSYYRSLHRPEYLKGWLDRVGDFEGFEEAAPSRSTGWLNRVGDIEEVG